MDSSFEEFRKWALEFNPQLLIEFGGGPTVHCQIAFAAWQASKEHSRSEAEMVCGEAYQVVGSLLSDVGAFETDEAGKILDNLSEARMVHDDVLPWPSFARPKD